MSNKSISFRYNRKQAVLFVFTVESAAWTCRLTQEKFISLPKVLHQHAPLLGQIDAFDLSPKTAKADGKSNEI